MVSLAPPVDLDDLLPHEHLAVHPARHLVAVDARVRVRRAAVGLPLEVEAEGDAVAPQVAVDLGGVVDPDGERLDAHGHVVERGLDGEVGPQALGADLERRGRGQSHIVVDHGHEGAAGPDEARPVPGAAEAAAQSEAHVAGHALRLVDEVQVVALAPEQVGPQGWRASSEDGTTVMGHLRLGSTERRGR
ncbi:MAG: hypothetical protein R2746_13695 [Acidimicrobiales bacterium]